MAAVLGRAAEARRYRELFEKAKSAFNRASVDPEGRIQGDTQGGYALALNFDLLPEPLRAKAARRMVEGFSRYDGHLSTGIQTTHRLMVELTRYGFGDRAYRLLNLRSFPSWGFMIDQGASTIWERWDGYVEGRGFQNPGMNSFNHVALGSVGEWIWRSIAGINPDEGQPGYKHFVIRPLPGGGLTWARAVYRSIRGTIVSDWKIEAGKLTLRVTVPCNTTATVFVPTRDAAAVTEDGKPTAEATGVKFEGFGDGAARYRVVSGSYAFAAPF